MLCAYHRRLSVDATIKMHWYVAIWEYYCRYYRAHEMRFSPKHHYILPWRILSRATLQRAAYAAFAAAAKEASLMIRE